MDFTPVCVEHLLAITSPWPSILAFDVGRYLVAALVLTAVLALASRAYVARRRVRLRTPGSGQRLHELGHSLGTALVFSLVGLGVYHGVEAGIFGVYSRIADRGWLYWIASLILIVLVHDTYFYWTHRWLHHPWLFVRLHRTHHVSVAPTQWAAYSFSVREALTQAAFLPLFLVSVPTHELVLFIWMGYQVIRNVMGHCGVELIPLQWLAARWWHCFTTTLHHDLHHASGRWNYGLYFAWWDRWCDTEHPEYRARLAALIDGGGRSPTQAVEA